MGDWRLQGQERFLKRADFRWATYVPYREGWDHDHCEFCGVKFSMRSDECNAGYVTKDGYHWVCERCYEDFKSLFEWKVSG
jgi:hypothetical protein